MLELVVKDLAALHEQNRPPETRTPLEGCLRGKGQRDHLYRRGRRPVRLGSHDTAFNQHLQRAGGTTAAAPEPTGGFAGCI